MPTDVIDIFAVTSVTVGNSIPSPAREQIAEILKQDADERDYVRGRVFNVPEKSYEDFVLVWNKKRSKWELSHRLRALQVDYLETTKLASNNI